jgi:hypothetical protein
MAEIEPDGAVQRSVLMTESEQFGPIRRVGITDGSSASGSRKPPVDLVRVEAELVINGDSKRCVDGLRRDSGRAVDRSVTWAPAVRPEQKCAFEGGGHAAVEERRSLPAVSDVQIYRV